MKALIKFFGDGDHKFALTPDMIAELEAVCEIGVGSLCRSLFNGDFKLAHAHHVIRLGLVGGGMRAEVAARLVQTYSDQPIAETYNLAVSVLESAWFGFKDEPDPVDKAIGNALAEGA